MKPSATLWSASASILLACGADSQQAPSAGLPTGTGDGGAAPDATAEAPSGDASSADAPGEEGGPADAGAPVVGHAYYVDSTATPPYDGSHAHPWKTIAQMTAASSKFQGGDVVHFWGTFAGEVLGDSGNGLPAAHLVFQADGGNVPLGGISLVDTTYVEFVGFEVTRASAELIVLPGKTGAVRFVWFKNLYLHDGLRGVHIGANSDHTGNQCAHVSGQDITFENTTIARMQYDGIVLDDCAGDRFSFVGGKIVDTGLSYAGYGTHGMYLSGGHGHRVDGTTFGTNHFGWSVSIRRGHTTVQSCVFNDCPTDKLPNGTTRSTGMINDNNEDEGANPSVTPPQSDDPPHGLTYLIARNLFLSAGTSSCTAIYQSSPNDAGVADPNNTWAVFNNTFVNTAINFADSTGYAQNYDIHLRNNLFVGGTVRVSQPASGRVHQLSNNGYFLGTTTSLNGLSAGPGNVTDGATSPLDPVTHAVTAPACADAGTATIIPPAVLVMTPQNAPPLKALGFLGAAPDIGHSER
jgi:hypothetical protein